MTGRLVNYLDQETGPHPEPDNSHLAAHDAGLPSAGH